MEAVKRQRFYGETRKDNVDRLERLDRTKKANESFLTVWVIEAQHLSDPQQFEHPDPFVIGSLGDQQAETGFWENTGNPVWDENFRFDVESESEPLIITVKDRDIYNSDDLLGSVTIRLSTLWDQLRVDWWYDLETAEGVRLPSSVHLELQWIHSKRLFILGLITQDEERIKKAEREEQALDEQLDKLVAPFSV